MWYNVLDLSIFIISQKQKNTKKNNERSDKMNTKIYEKTRWENIYRHKKIKTM